MPTGGPAVVYRRRQHPELQDAERRPAGKPNDRARQGRRRLDLEGRRSEGKRVPQDGRPHSISIENSHMHYIACMCACGDSYIFAPPTPKGRVCVWDGGGEGVE